MDAKVKVSGRIARPVGDVFEAVADPGQLSRYFTTGGAMGRLESGATVSWEFADFPGAFPVKVIEVEKNRRIVLKWGEDRGNEVETTVTMSFEPLEDGRTLVTITEEGWRNDEAGYAKCIGNTEGWTGMLCAMKVWTEHGINLREGLYK